MICYICSNIAVNSVIVHDDMVFSYCEEHAPEVAIGITEYAMKGTIDRLEQMKAEYRQKFKGSAYNEFEKCKAIVGMLEDNDSSVTEQAI